jgi:hypothetical protein
MGICYKALLNKLKRWNVEEGATAAAPRSSLHGRARRSEVMP